MRTYPERTGDHHLDTGAAWVYHECVQRFIPVKFSVRGRDLGGTVEEAQSVSRTRCNFPRDTG